MHNHIKKENGALKESKKGKGKEYSMFYEFTHYKKLHLRNNFLKIIKIW
jgi:hypothetical protein